VFPEFFTSGGKMFDASLVEEPNQRNSLKDNHILRDQFQPQKNGMMKLTNKICRCLQLKIEVSMGLVGLHAK
jgi:hypothetical protein